MHPGCLLRTVAVLTALLGHALGVEARVVRVACRDGVPPPPTKCVAGCVRPVRCDTDVACDATCTFAIRVCGEFACVDHVFPAPVGEPQKVMLATALGARPTRFVLRCLPHPRRLPCPTTSTTSSSTTTPSTSTSVTLPVCPTTTTLGVPDCGGFSVFCLGPCRSGQACADVGGGQCGCAGPVLCGGTFSVCGGECPEGQACNQLPVPGSCPSIGCTCQ
jgi:hypothetical protein